MVRIKALVGVPGGDDVGGQRELEFMVILQTTAPSSVSTFTVSSGMYF